MKSKNYLILRAKNLYHLWSRNNRTLLLTEPTTLQKTFSDVILNVTTLRIFQIVEECYRLTEVENLLKPNNQQNRVSKR